MNRFGLRSWRGLSFTSVAFALAISGFNSAGATSAPAHFNKLTQGKAPPSGYPAAGFRWSGFWVAPANDVTGFSTQAIPTTSATAKTGTVAVASGYVLTSFQASTANSSSTVSVTCTGNSTVTTTVVGGATATTIQTNWTAPCMSAVKFTMSDAWATDLNNLTFTSTRSPTPIPTPTPPTPTPTPTPISTPTPTLSPTSIPGTQQSLFNFQIPTSLSNSDGAEVKYELGTEFSSDVVGTINAIMFYKSPSETGTHTGTIWNMQGQPLVQVTFLNETPSGWQTQALTMPLVIAPNTDYVVSVNTGNSYYVDTIGGLSSQIVSGDISTAVGNNGLFGPVGALPNKSWKASNYFRDVVFQPNPSLTPPPTVTLTASPIPVTRGESSTLTYSSNYATSCTGSDFTPTGLSGSVAVSPTVTTQYSITCTNSAGSASANATVIPGAQQSLFNLQIPKSLSNSDGAGVKYELGTEFSSDVVGTINAIMFYKSPSETGTHTGTIWNMQGQPLVRVTFLNETPSGWQTQALAMPLVIAPNTDYVVSVNTGNSYYVAAIGGLSSQIVSGDLSTAIGNNGLFGPVGALPNKSWKRSNYFRDVVFQPNPNLTPPPTVTLTASPVLVTPGQSSTLTYSSNYATSCTGNGFVPTGISGSVAVSPTATAQYSITCTNAAGSASANATVTYISSTDPVIPANRLTLWKPGVTYNGGIPNRRTIYKTLSPLGNGHDDTPRIQAALNGCRANQVVLLNPGVYSINGNGLNFHNSNCTLRGSGLSPAGAIGGDLNVERSGARNEVLQPTGGGTYLLKADRATNNYGILYVGNFDLSGRSINLAVDAVKGSNTVTLVSNPGIQVGEYVYIDMNTDNDPDVVYGPSFGPPGGTPSDGTRRWFMRQDRSITQIMKVTAVNGNTLTFETPFHITFQVAYQAQLTRFKTPPTVGIGIEDIGFMGGMQGNVYMGGCMSCWIKHIESYWATGSAVGLLGIYRTELRDSFIHESAWPEPGGGGYLVSIDMGSSDNLIENNIMSNGNKVDVMRATGGGNVLGYNYTDDAWGFTYPQSPEGGINAGHYTTPHYELLEGNYSFNFKGDSYWGNSIYITLFRNWLSGLRAAHGYLAGYVHTIKSGTRTCYYPYGDTTGRTAVDLNAYDYNTNFVGNVLGMPNQVLLSYDSHSCFGSIQDGWVPESLGSASATYSYNDAVIMWNIGAYQATVNSTGNWSRVDDTYTTQLRQGNWDWVTKSQTWLGIGGTYTAPLGVPQSIPDSMYLQSKPAFMGSNPWPWVDPSTGATYVLPAKARFDAGTPNVVQ